jgi:hypothetical protein
MCIYIYTYSYTHVIYPPRIKSQGFLAVTPDKTIVECATFEHGAKHSRADDGEHN